MGGGVGEMAWLAYDVGRDTFQHETYGQTTYLHMIE